MENKDINQWVKLAEENPIPILRHTIEELTLLCNKDEIPIKEITHVVERDPGLVIHILRSSNNLSKGKLTTEITHVNQAFRLMGTNQLTKLPKALPALGDALEVKTKMRVLETFNRAYHAARFATDWAFLRRDMTPDEVFAAAQLHFLGEMVLAIHAPELLHEISSLRITDHIPSEEAQYLVLGFTLNELTQKISERLKFPRLVNEALASENAKFPRAYGIMLGVQLARSISYEGWYAEHTMEIQEQIAEWMGYSLDQVIARHHKIAAEIAREIPQYDTPCPARDLPLTFKEDIHKEVPSEQHDAAICLIPQASVLKSAVQAMTRLSPKTTTVEDLIQHIVHAMHDGVGLNRVVFCRYKEEESKLEGTIIKGAENDPVFNRFSIDMNESKLFSHLMTKQQAVLMNEETRPNYWPLTSASFQKLIGTNSFVAMSIFVNGKPVGMFYGDRHTEICQVDKRSYNYFKTLCTHTIKIIEQLVKA